MIVIKLNSVFINLRQALVSSNGSRLIKEKNRVITEPFCNSQVRKYSAPPPPGTPGSGAGKGGGAGGSVRESGGGLGKYGAAQEEGYFYDKQKEALKNIKKKLKDKPTASDKQDK